MLRTMKFTGLQSLASALLALFLCCGSAGAQTYDASLLPADGNLSAPAGATVGWGYTVSNPESTLWLMFTGLSAGAFEHGTPDALFDLPILEPLSTLSRPYGDSNGLYAFQWDADAPLGFLNTGAFQLHAQWWDGDPLAGGHLVGDAPDVWLNYSVLVSAVPEPSMASLVLLGMGVLALLRRRASRGRNRLQFGVGRRADVECV